MAEEQSSKSQPQSLRQKRLHKFFLPLLIIALLFLGFTYRFHLSTPPQPTLCQANLFLIDEAISRWATNTTPPKLGNPADQMISQYLPNGTIPVCPQGATYQRGSLGMATTCPLHGVAQRHPSGSKLISFLQVFLWKQKVPGAATNATMQCRANLLQLHGALGQWSLEFNKPGGDLVQIPPLVMYLKGGMAPACPSGGKYYFTVASNFPCCTITGHTVQF